MSTRKKEVNTSLGAQGQADAVDLLLADHLHVARLFADFAKLKDGDEEDRKAQLVAEICRELTVHTQVEEEFFYPAVRRAIEDEDLMDEALVEQAGAKDLIRQLREADPEDALYDAKVTVLAGQIDHHVQQEERNMFLQARRSDVDLVAVGARMRSRKTELTAADPGDMRKTAPAPSRKAAPQATGVTLRRKK